MTKCLFTTVCMLGIACIEDVTSKPITYSLDDGFTTPHAVDNSGHGFSSTVIFTLMKGFDAK